jgi:hypothetical protein
VAVAGRNLPQYHRHYTVLKTHFDTIFQYYVYKDQFVFKRKNAENPPQSIQKSLEILSHLTVSALPLSPPVVENRTAILVFFPTDWNTVAFVYLVMS